MFTIPKFRFHKGGLAESMDTVIDVYSKDDIANAFNDKFNANISASDIVCRHYGYDSRIGWDSYIITHNDSVIGFSNFLLLTQNDNQKAKCLSGSIHYGLAKIKACLSAATHIYNNTDKEKSFMEKTINDLNTNLASIKKDLEDLTSLTGRDCGYKKKVSEIEATFKDIMEELK